METNCALYLGLVLLLLATDCSFLDFKVNVSAETDLQDSQSKNKKDLIKQGSEVSSGSDSNLVDKGNKKKENQVGDLKEKTGGETDTKKNDDKNLSSQSGSGKDGNGKVKNSNNNDNSKSNDLNGQSESKGDSKKGTSDLNEKEKVEDDGGKRKAVDKENTNNGGHSGAKNSHVEECDPSNKCIDEENKLVACLRVPGDDQYSLLVQNKGEKPVKVTITAPDYVLLKETEIQLQSKEDKEVQVSISRGGSDNFIVLRAGSGHCDLDISHFVTKNFGNEVDNSQKSSYTYFMPRTPTIAVLAFAVLLVSAAVWTCISFRRKQISSTTSKYQRLDMELPVSSVEKPEFEHNNGWDDNWGNDWDDEEAPMTPSMPVTPSLSSKGLASRRLSKEGWKD